MVFGQKKKTEEKKNPGKNIRASSRRDSFDRTELARWEGALETREELLKEKEKELEKRLQEAKHEKEKFLKKLEEIAFYSQEEAKKFLLEKVEKKLSDEIAKKIKKAEEEIKVVAEEKAKEILVDAIRHGVTDWVSEYTVSTVRLPDEEIKGRIIGREGRNIRAFEQATGVEL